MIIIPKDIPSRYHSTFITNYDIITKKTGRLFLFAADHKMEHLDPVNPHHIFKIATNPLIGAFATHPGLIARYGEKYQKINYIAKLNGKTNMIPMSQKEPLSRALWDVEQVMKLKKNSKLSIRGVGYTIYLGSEFEDIMLREAAEIIQAHQYGLIALLWVYPRGKAVQDETSLQSAIAAVNSATCLGADFVKIKTPHATETATSSQLLKEVVKSAGNTKVIISGGEKRDEKTFLQEIYDSIQVGNISGAAIGRNIFEHDLVHASQMVEALSTLVYQNSSLEQAQRLI